MTTILEMCEIHLRSGQKTFRNSTVRALVHECRNLKIAAGDSTLQARALSITGHTADLDEALDEFEAVQKAVAELFDDNQALRILNRRIVLTLSFASQAMDIVERDAQMFITPKARKWIEKFREQMKHDLPTPGQARAESETARVHAAQSSGSKLITQKESQP